MTDSKNNGRSDALGRGAECIVGVFFCIIPRSAEVGGRGGEAGNSATGTIIELLFQFFPGVRRPGNFAAGIIIEQFFRFSAAVWNDLRGECTRGLNSATATIMLPITCFASNSTP